MIFRKVWPDAAFMPIDKWRIDVMVNDIEQTRFDWGLLASERSIAQRLVEAKYGVRSTVQHC